MAAPITHPSRGRIMIFYHVHAVNNWKWVVQDQLSKLIYSGLYNYATEVITDTKHVVSALYDQPLSFHRSHSKPGAFNYPPILPSNNRHNFTLFDHLKRPVQLRHRGLRRLGSPLLRHKDFVSTRHGASCSVGQHMATT